MTLEIKEVHIMNETIRLLLERKSVRAYADRLDRRSLLGHPG